MHYTDDLTPTMMKVLAFIRDHQKEHGYPPTQREVGAAMGWSSSQTAHAAILRLRERGLVNYKPSTMRSLVLSPSGKMVLETEAM